MYMHYVLFNRLELHRKTVGRLIDRLDMILT